MAPRRTGCSSETQDQYWSRIYLEINGLFSSVRCLKVIHDESVIRPRLQSTDLSTDEYRFECRLIKV